MCKPKWLFPVLTQLSRNYLHHKVQQFFWDIKALCSGKTSTNLSPEGGRRHKCSNDDFISSRVWDGGRAFRRISHEASRLKWSLGDLPSCSFSSHSLLLAADYLGTVWSVRTCVSFIKISGGNRFCKQGGCRGKKWEFIVKNEGVTWCVHRNEKHL